MTILNPKPIIERLEKDGPDVVRTKLAQGLYADFKVPLIKQWLKGEYVAPDDTVGDPDHPVTGPEVVPETEEPVVELTDDEVTVEEVAKEEEPVIELDEEITDDQLDEAMDAAPEAKKDAPEKKGKGAKKDK